MSRSSAIAAPRGRPRSFDVDAAVERAMNVFWSRGYHATALPDLLRATRLSRGSLYAAFGDKHSLFLLALDRYIADALRRMDRELGSHREPLDGLREYLSGYVERTAGANGRRGRLLVCSSLGLDGEAGWHREPLDVLREYLSGYVERTAGANGRRGCLLVATAMELAGHDAEVGHRVAGFFKAMEVRVMDVLLRAKAAGQLAAGV